MPTSSTLELAPPAPRQTLPTAVTSFAPTNFAELMKFAEILSQSDIVPKQYKGKAADIIVAIQYGAELSIPPMASLNSICVINGRPSLFGDGFLGIILAQPDCDDVQEDDLPEITASGKASCTILRRGRKPITRTFTMADATKAGLATKDGPWKQYPSRMLQLRARGFAGRDAYADVLRGVKIYEEVRDYPEDAYPGTGELLPPPAPDNPITQDQAREFGKAWKAAGRTIEQAKAFLKDNLGTESSLKIRASQYQRAMEWAKGNATVSATDAAASQQQPESPDKNLVFEMFSVLGYDEVKKAQAIKDCGGDWKKLAQELNKQLPEEK